jgi:SAM-dependent methyltransferase
VLGTDGTVADFLAAARAATIAGDHDHARAICVSLYRRFFASEHGLFASEHYYVRFVDVLLREGMAGTAETLMRDFTLTLQGAGQAEAQEALLSDAILRFPDNSWFATEYASLASQRGDLEDAACRWEAVRSRWPDQVPENLAAARAAPWLSLLQHGQFPIDNDDVSRHRTLFVPLPNGALRQTVSQPELHYFYFIGEAYANLVLDYLQDMEKRNVLTNSRLVLDIGCGVGKTARFLALDRRIQYVGFDIFAPAIAWARQAFEPFFGARLRFVHFDGISAFYNPRGTVAARDYEFPVADDSVDVALAASLFTHLLPDDCVAYLRQTYRKLQQSGRAVFSIKPPPRDSIAEYSGTEQSIAVSKDHFVDIARESGLCLFKDMGFICGQQVLIFERMR